MAVASAALTDSELRVAARNSIYAHAGGIMLQYFNHDYNRDAEELGKIRKLAREWCIQFYEVPTFRDIPLHQHPKIHKLFGTGTEPLSHELNKDAPDSPWLLFHPDAFNLNVVPWRRFNDERAETSRAETTTMKDFYQEPYQFGVLKAECATARKLNNADFKTATQHIRHCGSLNRFKPNNKSNTFPDHLRVTADDLWRDQAIVRYMPEFMAWLGYTPEQWAGVVISHEQRILYKNKNMALSGKMFFGRAEKIRLRQGGDGAARYRAPRHNLGRDLSTNGVTGLVKQRFEYNVDMSGLCLTGVHTGRTSCTG